LIVAASTCLVRAVGLFVETWSNNPLRCTLTILRDASWLWIYFSHAEGVKIIECNYICPNHFYVSLTYRRHDFDLKCSMLYILVLMSLQIQFI
jgi:hypothetical protein